MRIGERGEVEVKGPGVFVGYYKQDEATRDAITPDGWLKTGDAGLVDPRGQLAIIDRAKDVGKLADGTPFAPQFIENKLKFSPFIREAVAFGDQRAFVAAMVAIDITTVGKWAEQRSLAYTSFMDLARKPEVARLIVQEVAKINATLPATSKIRRVVLLNKELEADDAEMTRTRKVRRGFVAEKYAPVIEALYDGAKETQLTMDITFEDGRKSSLTTTLAVHDVAPARRGAHGSRREGGDGHVGFSECLALQLSSRGLSPGPMRAANAPRIGRSRTSDRGRSCGAMGPGDKPRDDTAEELVMWDEIQFGFALAVSGLSIGLMYSLIALGFVLVYKATDAINFAQGEFVMLAGFVAALVLAVKGMPVIGAVVAALAVMIMFSFGLERVVLRPLLGRPVVAVIMATIGLGRHPARAAADHGRRRDARAVAADRRHAASRSGPASLPPIQILGVIVTLAFLGLFTWFFLKSRMGVAMRAVADNQQVAMAMGINVERYFALAWAMAGTVSALGGVIWGSMLGVDVHLALVGLKVFPVVILGGLDSVLGAVIGGLIIGLVESLAAGYLDPYVGGGTKDFAPYVVMIIALMFKPYGMFGTHRIERV